MARSGQNHDRVSELIRSAEWPFHETKSCLADIVRMFLAQERGLEKCWWSAGKANR